MLQIPKIRISGKAIRRMRTLHPDLILQKRKIQIKNPEVDLGTIPDQEVIHPGDRVLLPDPDLRDLPPEVHLLDPGIPHPADRDLPDQEVIHPVGRVPLLDPDLRDLLPEVQRLDPEIVPPLPDQRETVPLVAGIRGNINTLHTTMRTRK